MKNPQKSVHQKVTPVGKAQNRMKNAVLAHSTKHEKTKKPIDLIPSHLRH